MRESSSGMPGGRLWTMGFKPRTFQVGVKPTRLFWPTEGMVEHW